MRRISPLPIWKDGSTTDATKMECSIIKDNLIDSATLAWSLLSENTEILSEGTLQIYGDDYTNWSDNVYAWNYIADKLGLTFV